MFFQDKFYFKGLLKDSPVYSSTFQACANPEENTLFDTLFELLTDLEVKGHMKCRLVISTSVCRCSLMVMQV